MGLIGWYIGRRMYFASFFFFQVMWFHREKKSKNKNFSIPAFQFFSNFCETDF